MTVTCHSCHAVFTDYAVLARHVISSKKGHRRGKKWAASMMLQVKRLDRKVTQISRNQDRLPMTEEQKETKRSLVREISGQFQNVLAVCPRCKKGHEEEVEVEYLQSETAWNSQTGKPMILCVGCR